MSIKHPVTNPSTMLSCEPISCGHPHMTLITLARRISLAVVFGLLSLAATAQMTGYTDKDLAVLDGALAAAMNATSIAEPDAAKVSMEELFRQWRVFRAKNFGALENSANIIKGLEAAGSSR